MVDAYTFDDGSGLRKFKSKREMWDWMLDNNHMILEGDEADKFETHAVAKNHAMVNEIRGKKPLKGA